MKLTKIQLSECIQNHLKINTSGMTTEQMIKIVKHLLDNKEIKDIIISTLILPHCSLPTHNKKDKLCLSMDELKKLANKYKIRVSQTREKLCQELESKGLLKIIRKKESLSPKKEEKLIKLSPEEISLFKKYNLETSVNSDQLKGIYKQLIIKLHPDKGGDPDKFKEMYNLYELHVQFGFDQDITRFIKKENSFGIQKEQNCVIF
jgi:hypothetical protein